MLTINIKAAIKPSEWIYFYSILNSLVCIVPWAHRNSMFSYGNVAPAVDSFIWFWFIRSRPWWTWRVLRESFKFFLVLITVMFHKVLVNLHMVHLWQEESDPVISCPCAVNNISNRWKMVRLFTFYLWTHTSMWKALLSFCTYAYSLCIWFLCFHSLSHWSNRNYKFLSWPRICDMAVNPPDDAQRSWDHPDIE